MARKAKTSNKKMDYTRPSDENRLAAVIKLAVTEDRDKPLDSKGREKAISPPYEYMQTHSERIARHREDSEAISQILPDMEHCKRVLVAAVISPRNMDRNELGIGVDDSLFNGEITGLALKPVRQHFKEVVKLDKKLTEILERIFFKEGSYSMLVLPENTIDELIRGGVTQSNESYLTSVADVNAETSLGWIGSTRKGQGISTKLGMEAYGTQVDRSMNLQGHLLKGIEISDNFNILKKARLNKVMRQNAIARTLAKNGSAGAGLEGRKFSEKELKQLYDSNAESARSDASFRIIRPQIQMERKSVGHPLLVFPPPESVIPAHVPGRPSEHVGYYVLVDPKTGSFLSIDNSHDYYNELRSSYKADLDTARGGGGDEYSATLDQIRKGLGLDENKTLSNAWDEGRIHESYRTIIEDNLLTSLSNGLYDEDLDVTVSDDIINVFLWRQMKNRRTQLLFIPSELLTYIAFDYDNSGFGESLVTKTRVLNSVRAALFFANAMGKIQNARPRRRVDITVGDKDPDPYASFDELKQMVIQQDRIGMCIGGDVANPNELAEIIGRGGYEFSLKANDNPGVAGESIEYDDFRTQVDGGDDDYDEKLRSKAMLGMGLHPELFDPDKNPDFAVSVVNNNLMLTRMVIQYQSILLEHLNKVVRTYTLNSSSLINEIQQVFSDNKKLLSKEQKDMDAEELTTSFINAITCTLPEPDNDRVEEQKTALDNFSGMLDTALDAYLLDDIFPEGPQRDAAPMVRATIKAKYMREYMNRMNILPQLQDLLEVSPDNKPAFSVLDVSKQLIDTLGKSVEKYVESITPKEPEPEDTYGGDPDGGAGDGDGLGDDDDLGGGSNDGDDDGLGDDGSGDSAGNDGDGTDDADGGLDDDLDDNPDTTDDGKKDKNLDDKDVDELDDEKL